jgi:hypothetical protein
MINSNSGYVCIDPLSYFYLIGLIIERELIPEDLITDDIFQLGRTKGTTINTIFVSKVQLIMELGIQSYKLLLDVLHSGIINDTYDVESKNQDFMDDLMRYMYCTKYIYKINPDNPLGMVPNKHHVIDENSESSVMYQTKKANLIRSDKSIKFNQRTFDQMLVELNDEYMVNTQTQTFVNVSKTLQDEVLMLVEQKYGNKQPVTYITQFIIMCTIKYYNEHNQFPFVPYDLAQTMLGYISHSLHE